MDSETQFGNNTRDAASSGEGGHHASGESRQSLADQLREQASSRLAGQKDRAVQGLTSLADAARQTSQQLRDKDQSGVATYLESAADQVVRFSERMRDKDLGEIVNDVERFAHRQPAVFLGVSFGIGLLGARFLKSSRSDRGTGQPNAAWRGRYPMASSAATAGYSGNPSPTPRMAITPPPSPVVRTADHRDTPAPGFGNTTRLSETDDAVGAASGDVRRGTSGPRTARRSRSEQ